MFMKNISNIQEIKVLFLCAFIFLFFANFEPLADEISSVLNST